MVQPEICFVIEYPYSPDKSGQETFANKDVCRS
jgi:hypothetical protein